MEQNGEDGEGLNGFLKEDIEKGLAYGQYQKCDYCAKKGATLRCTNQKLKHKDVKCKKKYHFTCGVREGTHTFIFRGTMDSFCSLHRPEQKYELKVKDRTCLGGCQEKIDENDERSFNFYLLYLIPKLNIKPDHVTRLLIIPIFSES